MLTESPGAPVTAQLLEVWQANAAGIYPSPFDLRSERVEEGFRGWGRVISDFDTGLYAFDTVKPGVVPGRQGQPMAPHLNLWIVARGINVGLNTRMYFGDEAAANAADPVLNLVEQVDRRGTLIAPREERDGTPVYRFDIRLQGDGETVFLDI
jgi:protocatechuate 3,4-dioxygenase alpha subunit